MNINLKVTFLILLLCFEKSHAKKLGDTRPNFNIMSCQELMDDLIATSSFQKQIEKNRLAFAFERSNKRSIYIKFVWASGSYRGVYGNFTLDLVKKTLKYIDPDPPTSIIIEKDSIPFIAAKCTEDENVYISTGNNTGKFDND